MKSIYRGLAVGAVLFTGVGGAFAQSKTESAAPAPNKAKDAVKAPQSDGSSIGIPLQSDGLYAGRLGWLDNDGKLVTSRRMNVRFVRKGRVIASTQTNDEGYYQVAGLEPNTNYSVLANTPEAYAAFGIRVLPALKSASTNKGNIVNVSYQVETIGVTSTAAIPASDFAILANSLPRTTQADPDSPTDTPDLGATPGAPGAPAGGGGGGFGPGGGGGGAAGGLGAGGLAGLGVAGAGVAAAAAGGGGGGNGLLGSIVATEFQP